MTKAIPKAVNFDRAFFPLDIEIFSPNQTPQLIPVPFQKGSKPNQIPSLSQNVAINKAVSVSLPLRSKHRRQNLKKARSPHPNANPNPPRNVPKTQREGSFDHGY